MQYATPYKGNGRMVAQNHATTGLAQAPTAAMSSTSSFRLRTTSSAGVTAINTSGSGNHALASTANHGKRGTIYQTNAAHVTCISTAAMAVQGGVTTKETSQNATKVLRRDGGHPGDAYICEHCVDDDDDGICDICGHHIYDPDDYCGCPLECDKKASLFLAMLAGAYALYKVRAQKKQEALA